MEQGYAGNPSRDRASSIFHIFMDDDRMLHIICRYPRGKQIGSWRGAGNVYVHTVLCCDSAERDGKDRRNRVG